MARPDFSLLSRLLRTADYRRLWLLGGIANAMRWLELLAATLWTFEETGSALAVSAVAMMRALPMLLLGAIVLLVRSMSKHLNRLPRSFDPADQPIEVPDTPAELVDRLP